MFNIASCLHILYQKHVQYFYADTGISTHNHIIFRNDKLKSNVNFQTLKSKVFIRHELRSTELTDGCTVGQLFNYFLFLLDETVSWCKTVTNYSKLKLLISVNYFIKKMLFESVLQCKSIKAVSGLV